MSQPEPCLGWLFYWRYSLTKPLILPGVNKKALANKIRFEVVDVIEKTENIELSESFLMGRKNVSRLLAENMPCGQGSRFCPFTGYGANDAMINFSTPLRGQQVLTPLGSEQTTSLLVVLIVYRKFTKPRADFLISRGVLKRELKTGQAHTIEYGSPHRKRLPTAAFGGLMPVRRLSPILQIQNRKKVSL